MALSVIDIEASGFGSRSYPVEIGVVREDGERYCRLICPHERWTHWDPAAEEVHGLSRDTLIERGVPPAQVARELNTLLEGYVVYSDAWVVDDPWLIRLYAVAGVQRQFEMRAVEMILNEAQLSAWDECKRNVIQELAMQRHRASTDALVVQLTFDRTLKQGSPLQ